MYLCQTVVCLFARCHQNSWYQPVVQSQLSLLKVFKISLCMTSCLSCCKKCENAYCFRLQVGYATDPHQAEGSNMLPAFLRLVPWQDTQGLLALSLAALSLCLPTPSPTPGPYATYIGKVRQVCRLGSFGIECGRSFVGWKASSVPFSSSILLSPGVSFFSPPSASRGLYQVPYIFSPFPNFQQ